jgi:hypothetical protein
MATVGRRRQATMHEAPQPRYPCTECGKEAYLRYGWGPRGQDWGGKTKKGEKLCTSCFQKRGGERFL